MPASTASASAWAVSQTWRNRPPRIAMMRSSRKDSSALIGDSLSPDVFSMHAPEPGAAPLPAKQNAERWPFRHDGLTTSPDPDCRAVERSI